MPGGPLSGPIGPLFSAGATFGHLEILGHVSGHFSKMMGHFWATLTNDRLFIFRAVAVVQFFVFFGLFWLKSCQTPYLEDWRLDPPLPAPPESGPKGPAIEVQLCGHSERSADWTRFSRWYIRTYTFLVDQQGHSSALFPMGLSGTVLDLLLGQE